MQNRYVGDIGDFGKYGLLRALFCSEGPDSGQRLRLGVVWYLNCPTLGELLKNDGKYTSYLNLAHTPKKNVKMNTEGLRVCNEPLWDALRCLVSANKRNVTQIRCRKILPGDTLYYERCLCPLRDVPQPSKQKSRESWLASAFEATKEANVIFVDPDNGIRTDASSPKHVSIDELRRFFQRDFFQQGQSLVIYHHLGRTDPVDQIKCLSERLRRELDLPRRQPWALRYRRGSPRVYFIIAQKQHEPILWDRLTDFRKNKCWLEPQPGFQNPHFELVE